MSKEQPVAHTHIIEANTVDELKQKVADLNAALNPTTVTSGTPAKEAPKSAPPKKAAKKETPPPAEEPEAEETEEDDPFADDEAEEGDAEETEEKVTLDQVRAALQEVGTEHGVAGVKAILKKFGAKNYKDVKEGDFAKVLKACKAA
jgi:hypothetical protein